LAKVRSTFGIGIISDTHGLPRPEAENRLAGVDHIIHGADIAYPDIISSLLRIAPVTAIRGNIDRGDWVNEYAATVLVRFGKLSIFVLHDFKTLRNNPAAFGIDVAVSDHFHIPRLDTTGSMLYLNPGSAGRRRFRLPISLATLDLTPDGL
jgi:putative phosphoesterase